ncbi:DUF1349 domain-containing protein [Kutzneria sp. NPDC052558]|uniref:DUF1349 domain-containing protein n=1 Tax=Kutzneria sp. NPDC052558 TaxID=3364121 RepID=UPI0037C56D51
MSTTELLRREWSAFRRPGRLVALAAAALAIIGLGLLYAVATRASCEGTCPAAPVAADGSVVSDRFWFVHRDLGRQGSVTVRLASMTGTITYPPPDHDQIVPGLVPWAKAGVIVKDGVRQGSAYAALSMTGSHGVHFQHDYRYDVAGSAGSSPRWLRLTRSGDTITAFDSVDGQQWHTVGTATLAGLPDTAQVGLFATSPGDLTVDGPVDQFRFSQAVGVFDHLAVTGGSRAWRSEAVGEMNHTDWEKHSNPSGSVEKDGVTTVSGTGDIGPLPEDPAFGPRSLLPGLLIALIIVLITAAAYGAKTARDRAATADARAARAAVIGLAAFLTTLLSAGIVVPVGLAILRGNGIAVQSVSVLTGAGVVVGLATVVGLCAVFAFGLGVWLRRGWAATVVGLALVAVPYGVTVLPLLSDSAAEWLLRLTPAAAFAVQQTSTEYPQVTAHYAPAAGYFPLPWWLGLAVLCGYTALVGRRVVQASEAA